MEAGTSICYAIRQENELHEGVRSYTIQDTRVCQFNQIITMVNIRLDGNDLTSIDTIEFILLQLISVDIKNFLRSLDNSIDDLNLGVGQMNTTEAVVHREFML